MRLVLGLANLTYNLISGPFSCLIVRIKLQRQLSYYLAQTYIPTTLMVMLSWVSFWIDMDAVPARVSLGLLTGVSGLQDNTLFPDLDFHIAFQEQKEQIRTSSFLSFWKYEDRNFCL